MARHIWIQLTKGIKPRETVEIGGGQKVSGATWLENECQRINATGSNALIYDFGKKGGAIFVRVAHKFWGKTEESLSAVERDVTEQMEDGGEAGEH